MRKTLMISAASFALGAAAMAYVKPSAIAAPPRDVSSYHMLELFGDVLTTVKSQYVTKVDDKKLIEAAIDGMLTSLDPHSGYLNLEGFDEMRDQTRGEYGGLGLEVTSDEGVVKIISPMDDTPASRAKLQAGDYITAIDGQSLLGLPLSDAVKSMRGGPGSKIVLSIAREKQDPFDVTLTREVINVKSVKTKVQDGYGYLRIASFNEKTGEETRAAVRELMAKSPHIKGLVLDLRNNPGGLLDAAVEVSDVFLDGGEVVSQRGRDARDIERYNAKPGDLTNGVPMAVLINSGSASAAEIVAGALQDRHRAELVGLTSFGKGSVQTVIPLRGGMDGALKLTTARYYTPSGRSIQQTGIEPDLEVAASAEQAELVATRSFQFSEASFRNALNADEGKVRRKAHAPAEAPPKDFDKEGDFQLDRAVDVLQAGGVTKVARLPVVQAKFAQAAATAPDRAASRAAAVTRAPAPAIAAPSTGASKTGAPGPDGKAAPTKTLSPPEVAPK